VTNQMPQVQLMATCLIDTLAPRVGRAAIAALEAAGCDVELPAGQTCCGQPAMNVGLADDARTIATHTLDVFDGTEGTIVVPSGSCAEMLIHHYPRLFAGTDRAEQAGRISDRTMELTRFLADEVDSPPAGDCDGCSVAVQYSCHGLRGLGLDEPMDRLLDGVERASFDGDRDCCGFGGLFSLEMPDISAAIMNAKLDRLEASGADTLVSGDVSCLVHLEGGLRRRGSKIRVRHVAELLAPEEPE
jgi:L-lactate dehydrogenase complex protein LldE